MNSLLPTCSPLILPISKTVPASLIAMVDTLNESVGRYGLHFDVLNRSLVLREIPGWMTNMNAEKFVDDLLVWFASHRGCEHAGTPSSYDRDDRLPFFLSALTTGFRWRK